jgi:quercetin dioxygenase-like cupin family protein/DNA-binding XRE family transcriptional regulator
MRNAVKGKRGLLEPSHVENDVFPKTIEADASIGMRIRHMRLVKAQTLKQLSVAAGCSESLLSKIENGHANPSLKMIHQVAGALGVTVGRLFAQTDGGEGIILRAGERPVLATDQIREGKGLQLEPLIASTMGHLLECHINHIEPGARSAGRIRHEGEEFGYVLEGQVELTVDGRRYTVRQGDSFCFRSEKPHSWRNASVKAARVLWINTPPSF